MKRNQQYRKWITVMLGIVLFFPVFAWADSAKPDQEKSGKAVIEKTDATSEDPGNKPEAFVPENRFNFAQVVDGTEVLHDFVIQNKGTGDLKITRVRTG